MIDLGPHAAFILAAYGVTFVAVGALASFIVADDRRQRHLIAELERKGIKRRSTVSQSNAGKSKSKPKSGS
jgi:heme exporter protein D